MTRILSRHRRQNRILAGFWPSPTPSAEHAPTPAHPRTPAHLLDINNPDCHLLGKKRKQRKRRKKEKHDDRQIVVVKV